MEINKIHNQDCLTGLKTLPDNSIDCCVTSPPYYGLRDYGTATWEGGENDCKHSISEWNDNLKPNVDRPLRNTEKRNSCKHCGAIRIDNQIGLEETPELYVSKMVEVFKEVKRVMKKEGTLWLNIGDSYAGGKTGRTDQQSLADYIDPKRGIRSGGTIGRYGEIGRQRPVTDGLKPKDLIGIPWMLAFALRADGWYLRQDIIWHKPNHMPESVTDRCTKSHEYIFLLSKSAKYYYDAEAIKDDAIHYGRIVNGNIENKNHQMGEFSRTRGGFVKGILVTEKANKRSVWTVATKPYSDAHFATFPEDLIVDMIKAGCPENGIVLDPFMGAGTTALVASKLNRNYIGFELNAKYIKIAEKRLYQHLGMFNKAI